MCRVSQGPTSNTKATQAHSTSRLSLQLTFGTEKNVWLISYPHFCREGLAVLHPAPLPAPCKSATRPRARLYATALETGGYFIYHELGLMVHILCPHPFPSLLSVIHAN